MALDHGSGVEQASGSSHLSRIIGHYPALLRFVNVSDRPLRHGLLGLLKRCSQNCYRHLYSVLQNVVHSHELYLQPVLHDQSHSPDPNGTEDVSSRQVDQCPFGVVPDDLMKSSKADSEHQANLRTLTSSQHQVGQKVGNDAAPEFHAQVLPTGSAPKANTYQPNPVDETPGQANNPLANEETKADPLDFPGATSGDVHQGIGKPVSGQSSAEMDHDGKSHRARDKTGLEATGATGGSGLWGDESTEAKRLQDEHTDRGPISAREHNASMTGAESKEPVAAE
ncbi:hypothetical protein R6Q59_009906 [Mikania micrantha]